MFDTVVKYTNSSDAAVDSLCFRFVGVVELKMISTVVLVVDDTGILVVSMSVETSSSSADHVTWVGGDAAVDVVVDVVVVVVVILVVVVVAADVDGGVECDFK